MNGIFCETYILKLITVMNSIHNKYRALSLGRVQWRRLVGWGRGQGGQLLPQGKNSLHFRNLLFDFHNIYDIHYEAVTLTQWLCASQNDLSGVIAGGVGVVVVWICFEFYWVRGWGGSCPPQAQSESALLVVCQMQD